MNLPEERRNSAQTMVAIGSILSIMVGSIGLITFVQSSERRITTMEIRIEGLKESIEKMNNNLMMPKQLR